MAKLEIELSEFDALRDAKNKAENDLSELKQSHKEEVSELKNTIKDLEKKSRVIIKHKDRYFIRTKIDEDVCEKLFDELTNSESESYSTLLNLIRFTGSRSYHHTIYSIVSTIISRLQDSNKFVKTSQETIPLFSEHGEPDQYLGFDDVKLEVEKELKDQYINNQKKIQENLEQQIQDYENKYKNVETELQSKYDSIIKSLENKLKNSQEDTNKLKETHKEEVDKLKEELKEAQKTQEEKILEAEEKLKEAREVLKKLTNKSNKMWYQFWK